MEKRRPLDVRLARVQNAKEYLLKLEDGAQVHTPISPEFEKAMISALAQGMLPKRSPGARRPFYHLELFLQHTYLSRDALRWVTHQTAHFWYGKTAERFVPHPAVTAVEIAVLPPYPTVEKALEKEGKGNVAAWRKVARLWNGSNRPEMRDYYRFADEVEQKPVEVQELFERLILDTQDYGRRKVWDALRAAERLTELD